MAGRSRRVTSTGVRSTSSCSTTWSAWTTRWSSFAWRRSVWVQPQGKVLALPRLKEVCRHVESTVAGPFWVTIDVRFDGQQNYDRYVDDPALSAESIGRVYGVDPETVSYYP